MHNFRGGGDVYSWMAWMNVCSLAPSAIKINTIPLQNLAFILLVFKGEIQNLYFLYKIFTSLVYSSCVHTHLCVSVGLGI